MSIIPYHWTRGSSFSFGLQVREGTVTGLETVRAVAKTVAFLGGAPPGDDTPEAVVFATSFDAPTQQWRFTATAAQSETLAPGFLIADARLDLGSGVILQVTPCFIEVRERVTEAS